jgi:hypothetical protein
LAVTDSDKKRFAGLWVSYHELASGKRPSIESVGLAYKLLRPYPIDLIEQALEVHGRTSPYAPKPADVAKILMGSAEDRARRAWLDAKEAMARWGSHESVSLRDPWAHYAISAIGGWPAFGEISEDEAPFREKDFCRHYADAERMGLSWGAPGVPDHLAGRHEIANRMSGCAFELEIRDSSTPLRIVPRDEGDSPALRSGEISEEERQRNLAGVRQLVAGVLGQ